MNYKEHFVQRDHHRIYAREYAGEEPVIILMHGFPDKLHLYDRLLLLYQQFEAVPGARPAFFGLNEDLWATVTAGTGNMQKLREFRRPVRIIFGGADPYLNRGVANSFHDLFPASDLFLLHGARHYVQIDEPEEVARLILSMPSG